MIVIRGYFYFGQSDVFEDDVAIVAGAENLTDWLLEREYTNVLIEVVGNRERPAYEPMPIVFNEDPHYGFDEEPNNLFAALSHGASWGYFDPGTNNYRDGHQCPPVEWGITTERERAFVSYLTRIVSENPTVR